MEILPAGLYRIDYSHLVAYAAMFMRQRGTRILLLGTLALGAATGCSPDLSSIDAEVFAVAVEDFASSTDRCGPSVSGHRVLVDSTTLQAGVMTSDAQVGGETTDEEWAPLAPLLASLRERSSVGLPLSWQPPTSLGVEVTDLSSLEREFLGGYPGARCHLRLWLPGYSLDAKRSLVRFSWGPTAHGSSATYLLERTDQGWQIRWKHIAYYA
jgi:hypothetical protein